MSYDEVLRRTLVAMAKEAGTLIRKEELRRQALTASVNRPLAEALLKEINDVLKLLPDFEDVMRKAVDEALKEGKPIAGSVIEEIIKSLIGTIPLAFIDISGRMKRILSSTNELISTINKIINELSKEGMYLPKLEQIESKDDIISLSIALRDAKRRLQTIISFLKELEKHSE